MTPTLRCMDEASLETIFDPQDIQPGAIIAFSPDCTGPEDESEGMVHRVVKVKVEDGLHYYWPKGDADRQADGCWIPETDVTGYVVEVHRNTRPKAAALHAEVIRASGAVDEILDRYCGVGVSADDCQVSRAEYDEIMAASAVYECWSDVAMESEYIGHIPPNRCNDAGAKE